MILHQPRNPDSCVDPVRSDIMRAVKRSHTGPEIEVRRILHALGLRFRLHQKDLPGTPDIVLPKYQTAIFVNGCFWHRHNGCAKTTTPKTRLEFWTKKFNDNVARDRRNEKALRKDGWAVLKIWECQTAKPESLYKMLSARFL